MMNVRVKGGDTFYLVIMMKMLQNQTAVNKKYKESQDFLLQQQRERNQCY